MLAGPDVSMLRQTAYWRVSRVPRADYAFPVADPWWRDSQISQTVAILASVLVRAEACCAPEEVGRTDGACDPGRDREKSLGRL